MQNFEFYTPTRVLFGRGVEEQVGALCRDAGCKTVLLHYGGGSIRHSGLYDRVVASLEAAGVRVVPLGGVQPNPRLSLAREGIELCKREGVDLVLAVGGGSVLDSAKCIANGVANPEVDPWQFYTKEFLPQKALPVGVILTLAASGSEMSASSVITNEDGWLKRGFNSPTNRPLFALLNPELTFSVDPFQTGCGIVDILMHTMERYFTTATDVDLTDRIAEGLMQSVILAGPKALQNPNDYEARATLMWAGSLSHNDLTGAGRQVFMSVHQLEHELSGKYERVAHGAGLSVLFLAWARFICKHNVARFAQYAVRVWNCEMNFENPLETALRGIDATEAFYKTIHMPTTLRELDIDERDFDEIAEKATFFGARTFPDYIELGKPELLEILRMAL